VALIETPAGADRRSDLRPQSVGVSQRHPFARPDVNLAGFTLLTLNRDPSISVIDPLSGYKGSRMITELPLTSPGRDWAVGLDPPRLYVAEQDARHVTVIDTERWQRLADAALTDPPAKCSCSTTAAISGLPPRVTVASLRWTLPVA